MYKAAYRAPGHHQGISLKEMKIDASRFSTYEEFIADMFKRDFLGYQSPKEVGRYYFQVWSLPDYQLVGICAVLQQSRPGFYYIDHMGIDKNFRRQGLASHR